MNLKRIAVAVVLGYLLVVVLKKRSITLNPNSSTRAFQLVTDAAQRRADLDFMHDRERAKICRPVYFMMQNPDRMNDKYDWQKARIKLRCDSAAEDGGFPPNGTQYFI